MKFQWSTVWAVWSIWCAFYVFGTNGATEKLKHTLDDDKDSPQENLNNLENYMAVLKDSTNKLQYELQSLALNVDTPKSDLVTLMHRMHNVEDLIYILRECVSEKKNLINQQLDQIQDIEDRIQDIETQVQDMEYHVKDMENHIPDTEDHIPDTESHDPSMKKRANDVENNIHQMLSNVRALLSYVQGTNEDLHPAAHKYKEEDQKKEHWDVGIGHVTLLIYYFFIVNSYP